MIKKYISIYKDFGASWVINRLLYIGKLKSMKIIPYTEKFYEKNVNIDRINLFEFNVNEVEQFIETLSKLEQDKIINRANKAITGKILGFSSVQLDYGYPINWHLNPMSNKAHDPKLKWYRIPDFDKEIGDIKMIWEISRFTHFLDFTRAYILTKNKRYYQAFIEQLEDWLSKNPYSYGANYKCGQEATIRMTNVLICYSVFESYGLVSPSDKRLVKKIVGDSYKKVHSNFFYAHKCIKNNHTFTEILGKIIGAWCENDNLNLKKSVNMMNSEIKSQFSLEGGFKQYSNNYHRFVLQIFEILLKIETKLGFEVKHKDIMLKSTLLLYNLMNEEGFLPNYGSNDGALLFPLSNSDFRDYRPTINALYGQLTGKKLLKDGIYTEELIWFNGYINVTEELEKKPMNLNDIGIYSFKNENSMLLVHLNKLRTRPAHMDQLHIDLWYQEEEVFCDLGTFSYASELGYKLSLNTNHNTVYVPGKYQMNKIGAFMVYDWTQLESACYEINRKFSGSFESKNGYKHQRSIIKTNYGYEIIDEIDEKEFTIVFNTPLDTYVENNEIILKKDNHELVRLKTDNPVKINKQFRSIYYFKKEEINKIEITVKGRGKAKTKIILASERND